MFINNIWINNIVYANILRSYLFYIHKSPLLILPVVLQSALSTSENMMFKMLI